MTVILRSSSGGVDPNTSQVMSPNSGHGDSSEAQQSSDEFTAEEEAEQPTEVENSSQTTEPTPTTEEAPPAAPAPSEPSEPTEPSEQDGARPPDDVRSRASSHGTSMLDNQFGQRYDEAELTKLTEKLMGKEVPLPQLTDKKEEYARWKSEVTLRFPSFALDSITYGEKRYDSALGYTSMKYHTWNNTRWVLAFTSMVLSLDMNLRDLFKVDELRDQIEAPSLSWGSIMSHFTKGDGVNPDYILRVLLNHELKPGQTVEAYVKKSEELVRRLRAANGELEEWEHASLLLSNVQLVFRELAEQHTVWCIKNDRRSLTRVDATQRLRQAEQARSQVTGLQVGQPAQRAAQVVSFVCQGAKAAGKQKKKKRQGMSENELAQKKARTKCSNCSQHGHWYAECTAVTGKSSKLELADKLKAKNRKLATSFVGAVGVEQPNRVVQRVDVQVASPIYSPATPLVTTNVRWHFNVYLRALKDM
ncbi:unnamed protein product [Phytophthora fragariaefolia]|uniref:Unnamed protein product n=1 Tax=Phytophthora fragariaefolia TaxID=1490495 RepID=A0A9W6U0W0_9STRA|nr:unnamed protein product [Phytophthora fragariaefolia]